MSDYLDPENAELLTDFFVEAESQVEVMERNILALENDPTDSDSIDELFRAAHTLKGGAYTVQMEELAHFAHRAEDVLDKVRDQVLQATPAIVDLLLSSLDVIKAMLAERRAGSVYAEDIQALQESLVRTAEGQTQQSRAQAGSEAPAVAPAALLADLPLPLSRAEYDDLRQQASEAVYRVRVYFDESNPMNTIGAVQEFTRLRDLGTLWITHPEFEELYEDQFFGCVDFYLESTRQPEDIQRHAALPEVTLGIAIDPLAEELPQHSAAGPAALETESTSAAEATPAAQPQAGRPVTAPAKKAVPKKEDGASSVLRVNSRRVDEILNLVSEAVINKATFNQVSGRLNELEAKLRTVHVAIRDQFNTMVEKHSSTVALKELSPGETDAQRVKAMRKKLQGREASAHLLLDDLENLLKAIIAQFGNCSATLARNTNDLHEAILSIRMVSISQVFSRFPRLVRDLSRSLEKKIELLLEGEETEVDKSVAEELVDPLMHCVRNSVDHGIESAQTRAAAGKPEAARIKLAAVNKGSNVVIEISDDGGGISVERVRRKAVDNGMISPDKVLSDQEAFNLIFDPGFSTAQEITNISGRGVGLNVVKKQIEKLNGTVNVWSEAGVGTKFTIKLPLTLAIIQGLLVRVRSEVYAIPITAVVESIRITQQDIRLIDNYEVIHVRDEVISLLRLNRIFQLEEPGSMGDGYMFVVVVGTEDSRVGLMVDTLIGEEDVVIKPLVDRYTHSPGVAGATILGDGTVSLILDVSQLLDLGVQYERCIRQQL